MWANGLDEGDAGVGDVVVAPLGAGRLDVAFGVVDELLEAAVVEVGDGKHGYWPSSCCGMT